MKTVLTWCLIAMTAFSYAAVKELTQLENTVKEQDLLKTLKTESEGACVRLLPDGSFQIFGIGAATYAAKEPDELLRAQREATLKAKANISKFMSESISSRDRFEEISAKTKVVTEEGKSMEATINREALQQMFTNVSLVSEALLRGVVVLGSEKEQFQEGGIYRVVVGVSSRSLQAPAANEQPAAQTPQNSQNNPPAQGQTQPQTAPQPPAPAPKAASNITPEGWIEAVGYGKDRPSAVSAALLEALRQFFGERIESNSAVKESYNTIKNNLENTVKNDKSEEINTKSVTSGWIQEYRILEVKTLPDGRIEARIVALVPVQKNNTVSVVMVCYPVMRSLADDTKVFETGPNTRLSGLDLCRRIAQSLTRSMVQTNAFVVIDFDEINRVAAQNKMNEEMIKNGLSPMSEYAKLGQVLTADYILSTMVDDFSYSRKMVYNSELRKFESKHSLSMHFAYKLTSVTTGATVFSDDLTVELAPDEISRLLEKSDKPDLVYELMKKACAIISSRFRAQ